MKSRDMLLTEPCEELAAGHFSHNTPTFSETGYRGSKLIDFNLEGSKMQLIRPSHENLRRVKTPTPYIKRLKVKERLPASPSSGVGTFSITEDIHTKLKSAFTEFDFEGEGAIPIDRFITQHPLKKTGYSAVEIKEWLAFKLRLLGEKEPDKISLNAFKTLFFPVEVSLNGNSSAAVSEHQSKRHEADSRIKRKIANKFSTVRKAFLTLDYNYDGFIVAEDIIRLFINDNEHISYEEVSNLLRKKDRNGKLDFAKFCSWVGSLIEPNHGVFQPSLSTIEANNIPPPLPRKQSYRRSIVPPFMQHSHSSLIEAFHATPQLPGESKKSIMDLFTEKLRQHFKSIQKGFFNLSDPRSGLITLDKLRESFKTWSLQVDQEELHSLFLLLDVNKDGKINYDDFQSCIGTDILPQEKLYFRQEYPEKPKPIKCIYDGCWDQVAVSSRRYCPLHLALARKKAECIVTNLPDQLSSQWHSFLRTIAEEIGEPEFNFKGTYPQRSVSFSKFLKILSKYGRALDCEEAECLLELYELKDDFNSKKIKISFLNGLMAQNYVRSNDSFSSEDQGLFPFGANLEQDRKGLISKKKLSLKEEELAQVIKEENLLAQINSRLRKMDKDQSGLATVAEITRIFCDSYPILEDANFKTLLKKYQIEHNKMLIDYNRFVLALKKRIGGGGECNPRPRVVIEYKSPARRTPSQHEIEEPKLSSSAIDKILGIKAEDFSKTLTPLSKKLSPKKREEEMINLQQSRPFTPERPLSPEQDRLEMSPTPYIKPHFRRYQNAVLPRRSKSSIRITKHLQRNKSTLGLSPQLSMVVSPSVHKSSQFVIKDVYGKIARLREKILPEWREIHRQVRKIETNGTVPKQELQRAIQKQGIYLDRDQWRAVSSKCGARGAKDSKKELISIQSFIESLGLPRWNKCSPHSEKILKRLITMRSKSPLKHETFETEVIGRALTERLEQGKDSRSMKKKILLNWRGLYQVFKKQDGRSGLIPVQEFYKALRVFGIEIESEEAMNFIQGKQINFREFLKFHIGGQALDSSRPKA